MKYLAVFKVSMQDALAYRLEGFVWYLLDVLPPTVMIVLWLAAFQGRADIGGYSLGAMLMYYLATGVFGTLLTSHPEWNTAYEIRTGDFSRLLLKPVNPSLYYFVGEMAWKVMRLIFLTPVIAVAVGLLFDRIQWPALGSEQIAGLVLAAALSYALQFCLKLTLGYLAFWVAEPSGFFSLFGTVLTFLGGAVIPLDLMPPWLVRVSEVLPFHYFYYFPAQLLLGRVHGTEIGVGLLIMAAWCAAAWTLLATVYRAGIRDYAAVGG